LSTTTSAPRIAKIPTGVPGFDIISHGGIPEGRSTLVVGRSGTGKTIFGLQLAGNFARNGIKTVLVAVEESPDDLVTTGDTLGLGLSDLIAKGDLRVTDASRPTEGPMVVTGDYDISGLTHRIEAIVKQTGARAIVLDSATALFSPRPPQELLRSLFFQLVHFFKRIGLTAVILAEAAEDYGQLTTLGVEDYVCDVVIVTRNIIDGERRRRSIEINKYRRSAHYKGEYPCTITANGLTIFPLDAKDRADQGEQQRYSSGFPGLDGMIDGGLFRDSITIVRGPTGSGKTTLAGVYARSGAERGERVAYYGFEEPRPILLRNFAALGMDMDAMVKAGNLQVHCRYPEAMGLEDLLVGLRLGLHEFKPSLVVMDSISSIEHSSSEKGFRQFMVGLASLLREHGRSALLTQTTFGADTIAHTAPYLSTIADTILNLDYSIDQYDLSRTLRVLKMRGSSHVTHPYRLEIGQGGLKVEPQALKPGTEPFSGRHADRGRRLEGLRVLVVEDFADARETVKIVLQREGAIVSEAATAGEAIVFLQSAAFDVLVGDIGLPEADGLTMIQRIRALPGPAGRIPAVALTAWGLEEDKARALAAGYQEYIVKPTDPGTLAGVVAKLARPKSG
jgi:circadian clock protein KaiC